MDAQDEEQAARENTEDAATAITRPDPSDLLEGRHQSAPANPHRMHDDPGDEGDNLGGQTNADDSHPFEFDTRTRDTYETWTPQSFSTYKAVEALIVARHRTRQPMPERITVKAEENNDETARPLTVEKVAQRTGHVWRLITRKGHRLPAEDREDFNRMITRAIAHCVTND